MFDKVVVQENFLIQNCLLSDVNIKIIIIKNIECHLNSLSLFIDFFTMEITVRIYIKSHIININTCILLKEYVNDIRNSLES